MNNKRINIILTLITIAIAVSLFSFKETNSNYAEENRNPFQTITAPPLPTDMSFAGEKVPVSEFDIIERIDREIITNSFFHSQTIRYIKLTPRFFSIIEPILKKNGIPEDFKYLALAESGFDMKAVSPAGAAGIWQFMKPAAKENGLEISDDVDERFNIEKATEAACKYLKDSYKIYKNWTLVAASYNTGKSNVSQQIEKQAVDNYYDLLLSDETSRYLFRILALKAIIEKPEKYGFYIKENEKYPDIKFKYVDVSEEVLDLVAFAKNHGTNYKMIKLLNPWLKGSSLKNESKKNYKVKIPVK